MAAREYYKGNIPIFDLSKEREVAKVNPLGAKSGCVPRDWDEYPEAMMAGPDSITDIPESEWDAYWDEQEEQESSLEHIFMRGGKPAFVNLDQDGDGDCWAYSTGHAVMLNWLRNNVYQHGSVPRINPHYVATVLKRYNGGWCGASMAEMTSGGCCLVGDGPDEWPLWSHDARKLSAARKAAALKYRVDENVYDLTKQVWDQYLTEKKCTTLSFLNAPSPNDFNEMSHSMCRVRTVRVEKGRWRPLIINSWKGWGRYGLGVLEGMDVDGAVAVVSTT